MDRILGTLRALNAAGVSYVVVGGVAVVLRGHLRTTVDVDIALDLTTDNILAAVGALGSTGLRPRLPVAATDFADPDTRRSWVEERHLIAFTMVDPGDSRRELDLLADPVVPFVDLARDADTFTVEGVPVPVASVAHLIRLKEHAGRSQDLADIEALMALQAGRADE